MVYDASENIGTINLTGKERDMVVNMLKNARITRFGDAVIAADIAERLEALGYDNA